jgi:hypothetical protein
MDVSETLVLVPVGGLFAKRGPLGARDAGSPRLVSSGGEGETTVLAVLDQGVEG